MSQDALEDTIIKNWSRNIESNQIGISDNTVIEKESHRIKARIINIEFYQHPLWVLIRIHPQAVFP